MFWKKKYPVVAAIPIACIVFFLGISPAMGDLLIVDDPFDSPNKLLIVEPEFLPISKQRSLKVSQPNFGRATKGKSLKSGAFSKGAFEQQEKWENAEYLRCSKFTEFDDLLNCAQQSLGDGLEEQR